MIMRRKKNPRRPFHDRLGKHYVEEKLKREAGMHVREAQ